MNYTWPLWRVTTRGDRVPVSKSFPTDFAVTRRKRKAAETFITIEKLSKTLKDEVVYSDFDLSLPEGEFISIYGPDGSGKSALIQMISGLMPCDGGRVLFGGRQITEARLAYVFADDRKALLPWLSAIDNIRYPLRVAGMSRDEQDRRILELLSGLDLRFDLRAYPYRLSEGDRRMVAILRSLATKPDLLLLEDPFAGLDRGTRQTMCEQLQVIFLKTGTTMLLASHDLEEAIQLSDKVLILTREPTQVAQIVNVDLPWPRTAAVRSDPRFIELKNRCLEVYRHEAAA
jgi:NitT/TauT family transport system ATP-binding protein